MSQAPLITPSDLLQNGATSDFLAQFQAQPLSILIIAGGPLGTMTWEWQQVGDTSFSSTIPSEVVAGGGSWVFGLPDPTWAIATFAPGAYNTGDVYNVNSSGIVTGGTGGGIGLISATRFDLRLQVCDATTSKAVTWMLPRCTPPILSVGSQVKEWMSSVAIYALRSRQGITPSGAGAGDDNVRARAVDGEKNLKSIGVSQQRPPDIVDSSPGNAGAGFTVLPISGDLVGWGC